MPRVQLFLFALALTQTFGCANVKVKKVSVEDRAVGNDRHVKGFRYYLNRPYLVVSDRVEVSTQYIPAALTRPESTDGPFYLLALVADSHGEHRVYDQEGHHIPGFAWRTLSILNESGSVTLPGVATEVDDRVKLAALGAAWSLADWAGRTGKALNFKPDRGLSDRVLSVVQNEAGQQTNEIKSQLDEAIDLGIRTVNGELRVAGATIDESQKQKIEKAIHDKLVDAGTDEDKESARTSLLATALILRIALPKEPDNGFDKVDECLSIGLASTDLVGALVETDADKIIEASRDACGKVLGTTPPEVKELKVAYVPRDISGARNLPSVFPTETFQLSTAAAAVIPKPESTNASSSDKPAIQVAFLPDFEEQYVIRNKNFLAKTKYQYDFRNGMQLAGVAGSYNATDVPVKVLETVGNLITAAGKVAETALSQPITPGGEGKFRFASDGQVIRDSFFIKIEQAIEPGMYRVQKSWERVQASPGMPIDQISGLFSDVGLDLVETTSILTRDQYEKETGRKAEAKPAS